MTFFDAAAASQDDNHMEFEGFTEGKPRASDSLALKSSAACSTPSSARPWSNGIEDFLVHAPELRRYLMRRVSPADVEDVLQDIFLGLARRADLDDVEKPRHYLFRAAKAALVDRHRRQATRRASYHCGLEEAPELVDDRSPLRILLARNEVSHAEDILRELPDRTQEIIIAIRLEGMSLQNLASKYSISTSAIEKHVTKAAKALATLRREERMVAPRRKHSPIRERYLAGSI